MLRWVRGLRAHVERESSDGEPKVMRFTREREQVFGIAAEFPREIANGTRTTERHPQQHLSLIGIGHEFAQLVRVVGNEYFDTARERRTDIDVALDRVRVDTQARIGAELGNKLDLTGRRQIEKTTLGKHRLNHCRMRQRLQRMCKIIS